MITPTWTTEDLARLNEAIASGIAEVSTADGKKVRYQDMPSLIRARDLVIRATFTRPARPVLARISVR